MFSTSQNIHVSTWIQEWSKCAQNPADETPEQLKQHLLEPLMSSDPVFCTALAHELCLDANLSIFLTALSPPHPSRRRVFHCELIFYLCRCPSPESRRLAACFIPILLWMEWRLSGSNASTREKGRSTASATSPLQNQINEIPSDKAGLGADGEEEGDLLDEDITGIEIALLAAYQQDFGVAPLAPSFRVPTITKASIYHPVSQPKDQASGGSDWDNEIYPWGCDDRIITIKTELYPNRPLCKFDESTRIAVTYRLCRAVVNQLPDLPSIAILYYSILMARLAVAGTKLDNTVMTKSLQSGMLLSPVMFRKRNEPVRSSDILLSVEVMDVRGDELVDSQHDKISRQLVQVYFNENFTLKRRYPLGEDLVLLWAGALSIIKIHFPVLEEHVRSQLLQRSRTLAFPAAILALSAG